MNAVRIFAVLFGTYVCAHTIASWRWQLDYFRCFRQFDTPSRLLSRWTLPRLSEPWFERTGYVLIAGVIAGILGVRVGFGLAAIAALLYFGQIPRLDSVQRKTNLLPQVLALLALTPSAAAPWQASVDEAALVIIKTMLALVYVGAGLAKLRQSGLGWADGQTLQAYLIAAHLAYDIPRARWLAGRPVLCRGLSAAVLTFECTGWLLLFVPRGEYLFAIGGLALHAGTLAFMRVNFLKYHGAVFLVFVAAPASRLLASIAGGS